MDSALSALEAHPNVDAAYLRDFLDGTIMMRVVSPRTAHYTQGLDPKRPGDDPVRHGLALRLFIPYPDAKIVDARIDGRPVGESSTHGIMIRREPGTIAQFNVPPDMVGDIHVVTCEYETSIRRPSGFGPKHWDDAPIAT